MSEILTFTGIIKLKNNGDFFIANEGRRPIYIDGRPVLSGNKWKLNNNSVVEVGNTPLPSEKHTLTVILLYLEPRVCFIQIAGLRFVFLINLELISLIKAEAAKMTQQWPLQVGTGTTRWGRSVAVKEAWLTALMKTIKNLYLQWASYGPKAGILGCSCVYT